MPGMDGLATLGEIKRIDPEVEVIILSGHASMDAAMEINRLGGYDYLMKPCPLEELLLKIEAAYEKKVEREKRTKKSRPRQKPPDPRQPGRPAGSHRITSRRRHARLASSFCASIIRLMYA